MSRKEWLEKEIERHDYLYWVKHDPKISDIEYDTMVRELKNIDPNSSVLFRIHTPVIDGEKIKHRIPMLSLDKVYTTTDLIKWANKVKRSDEEVYLIQNKYDGWSVEKMHNILSTRGNGFEGDNISNKLVYVKSINNTIVDNLYIHGELIMLKSDFEKYRTIILRKNGEQYKTPRTILSGLLTDDNVRDDIGRVLTLMPFDLFQIKTTYKELMDINWDILIKERKEANYPIDGLVLKLEDETYGRSLGSTSHHVKSAMALKFTNPTGETILRDVIWSVGKTKLTPIAIVDPVEIGGVTVDGPNLHNYKYILDKDIHIGDTLILERCGDIIPDVKEVIPGKNRIKITISRCPACEHLLTFNDTDLVCTNLDCKGKKIRKLLDSIIRIGIDGVGEPTVKKLVDNDFYTLIDIFNITKDDILKLERFGDTSSTNLLEEINRVINRGVYEWQILSSLNLPLVGERLSKSILEHMSLDELRHKQIHELQLIKRVGFNLAHTIYTGLLDNSDYLDNLLQILPIINDKQDQSKTKGGICFTGKMPKVRSYYEKLASENGFCPVDKVTKSLSVLVCADVNDVKGKIVKAKKYGVKIISIETFLENIGRSNYDIL